VCVCVSVRTKPSCSQ